MISSYPANALVMEMPVNKKKVGLEAQPFFQVGLLMISVVMGMCYWGSLVIRDRSVAVGISTFFMESQHTRQREVCDATHKTSATLLPGLRRRRANWWIPFREGRQTLLTALVVVS